VIRAVPSLALLLVFSLTFACKTPGAVSPSRLAEDSGGQREEVGPSVSTGESWRPDGRGGRLEDADSGLSLELPLDWTWRRGSGDLVFEARGPDSLPASLRLSRWDGSTAHVEQIAVDQPLAFLSTGPHGGLDEIADEPPVVFTLADAGDSGELRLAWFFHVDRLGLSLEALLPAQGFESAWRAVDAIVRSAAMREGEGG